MRYFLFLTLIFVNQALAEKDNFKLKEVEFPKLIFLKDYVKIHNLPKDYSSITSENMIDDKLILSGIFIHKVLGASPPRTKKNWFNWFRHKSGMLWMATPNISHPYAHINFYIYKKKRYPFDTYKNLSRMFRMDGLPTKVFTNPRLKDVRALHINPASFHPSPNESRMVKTTGGGGLIVLTKEFVYFIYGGIGGHLYGEDYLKPIDIDKYYVIENEEKVIPTHDRIFDLSDPKIRENFEVLIGERRGDINNIKIKGKLKKIRIKGKWKDYLEMEKSYLQKIGK